MGRRAEREARETQAVSEVVIDVLTNWGIKITDGGKSIGDQVAAQIGLGGAVERDEVYAVMIDACRKVFTMTGKTDAPTVSRQVHNEAVLEIQRLRQIIRRAYSSEAWDIGIVKDILLAGLPGYEQTSQAKREPLHSDVYSLRFGEGSSRDHWWIELALTDMEENEHAVLAINDRAAMQLSERLDQMVREGRRDWDR
jgi:hypothetical protein